MKGQNLYSVLPSPYWLGRKFEVSWCNGPILGQLNNCFFYFEPNHPFLQRISEIWSGFPPYVKRNGPIGGTGPGLFHKVRSNRPELTPEIYPVGEMLANWGAEGFPNAAVLHYNHGGWLRKSDVQVGAWTMILPRAEVDHFEEWLSYQKKLGIRHVWVYLDEDEVSDGQIGQKGGVEWDKKPEVDYHPEMTEDDVFRHLMEVADKVTGDDDETFEVHFRHVRHIDGYKERDSVGGRQELTVRDLVNNIRNQDEPHVDWLTLLDTDELIVVPEGLSQYLGKLPNNVASVKLKQKYFEGRWDPDGKPIPMAEIKENWGIVGFNVKHIIRPDKVVSCGSNRYPHCIHVVGQGRRSGQEVVPAWDRIRFHHFRGPVTVKFPNMFGLGAYDRVSKKPYKADDLGHAVYIDGSR